MRIVKVNKGKIWLRDDKIEGFFEKIVNRSGNSAKVDIPKRYAGKRVYVVVCKN